MKPLKILYTLQSGRMGGAEHSLYYLLKTLNRERFSPTVCFFETGNTMAAKLNDLAIPTVELNLQLHLKNTRFHGFSNPWALVHTGFLVKNSGRAFSRFLATNPPFDLIHTNSWLVNNIVLLTQPRPPVLWNVRDLTRPRLNKRLIAAAAKVVCVSGAVRALLTETPTEKFAVVHNGIDLDVFRPHSVSRQLARELMGVSEGQLVIGLFGRLTPLKGQDFFLRAVAEFIRQRPEIRIVIVGESLFDKIDYRPILEDLVADLQLPPQVTFLGPRDDLPVLLNGLDIYAHPTTTKDAFPRATLEAMATGIPTLAARLGGIVEQIDEGEDGLLFTPNDQGSLLAGLTKLTTSPKLRQALGKKGRQRVAQDFNLLDKTREMEKIYLEVKQ